LFTKALGQFLPILRLLKPFVKLTNQKKIYQIIKIEKTKKTYSKYSETVPDQKVNRNARNTSKDI